MNFLDGNKTYLTGLAMILMGLIQMFGLVDAGSLDGAGTQLGDPGTLISTGLGLIFVRSGIKKDTANNGGQS